MLLEEFDNCKSAVINPDMFHEKKKDFPKTCLSFFSKSIIEVLETNFKLEKIASISNATKEFPVYKLNVNGTDIAIYQSAVGAPACISNCEELIAMGVENLLCVGCCGCLDSEIEEYSIIIPTSAIRDEGTSYHYAPAEVETIIDEKLVEVLENVMKSHSINYKKGKTWTTDAIFRETRDKVNKRKEQGAITVDMECSALNVLAKFRGINFCQFFYGADNLGGEEYDPRTDMASSTKMSDDKKKIIPLAIECALKINELLENKGKNENKIKKI